MSYRKGLVLSLGLVNLIASINGATSADESLTSVCTGSNGNADHPPTPLKQQMTCSHCGVVAHTDIKKAQKQGSDQYVIIERDEVASLAATVVGATKKLLTLTVHDAEEVFASTLPGKSVYYVEPDGVAQTGPYSLLLDMIARHPEKAFLTEFTPTSRTGMYQLRAFNDVLVLQSLHWPEDLRAKPEVATVQPDDSLRAQADMVLASITKPFNVADYRNDHAAAMAALVASKEAVTGEVAEKSSAAPKTASSGVVDLSAQLAAMLGQAAPAPAAKKPRTRKTA